MTKSALIVVRDVHCEIALIGASQSCVEESYVEESCVEVTGTLVVTLL